jgi:RNA polymerase sigma-70 factor (ECF subfamily)
MDDDIQEQLKAGHYAEAFDHVLARYRDKVFRLAVTILRDVTQAEDAAQDVFVKIWKALPNFHGDSSLSTWIYTIARNTCLTELSRRAARPTVSLQQPEMEAVADQIPSLQSADPQAGASIDVKALLAQLPERQRQAITLFYIEQKAYEEVAAMLGIPLGTVKTLLFRAKKELLRLSSRGPRPIPVSRQPGSMSGSPGGRVGKAVAGPVELRILPNPGIG